MAVTSARAAAPARGSAGSATVKMKDAGAAVASTARRVPGPARAAGLAAAGLAGGLVLGSRVGRRRNGLVVAARAFADGAEQLGEAVGRVSGAADDLHQLREHLASVNRRSPIEVLLDGLTHRRGAHRLET